MIVTYNLLVFDCTVGLVFFFCILICFFSFSNKLLGTATCPPLPNKTGSVRVTLNYDTNTQYKLIIIENCFVFGLRVIKS